jgi:hypothetical protein
MIAEKPKKNQYPAYALKSDDGENEELNTEHRTHYLTDMLHKR